MFNFNTELAFLYAVFFFSLLSIFLTSWIVWHVEKKLDISYKFFQLAITVFGIGILFEILQFYNIVSAWQWGKIFKGLFIIFFTVGVFEMRDLILDFKNKEENRLKQVIKTIKTVKPKSKPRMRKKPL